MKEKIFNKPFYINPIAQMFLMAYNSIKVLIAGRGFGKSFDNGLEVIKKVHDLPRSKGVFIGVTYSQILTNTLLPMKSAWEMAGYYDGIHYIVGKRPPDHFIKPYQKPERYENVITFWNGTTLVFGSMDRPQLMRGASYDWEIADEALLIKKEVHDQIVQFTIRGTHPELTGKPGHLQQIFTSSMPYGSLGSWLLDYEIKAKQQPDEYFYIEGTSWHNRKVLGDATIKKWQRESSPLQFAVEVMNKRVRNFGSMFYPSLTDRHWYTDVYNYEHIDVYGLAPQAVTDSRWDKDCDPNKTLHVSHDWGAFNCIVIGQEVSNDLVRVIKGMHTSPEEIISDLANRFCAYYQHHKKKTVYQWGDKSGNKREANSKLTYFQEFAQHLRAKGWTVILRRIGDIDPLARYGFFNRLHKHEDNTLPMVEYNYYNCKDLRISLESAPMKDTKKDKSSENNPSVKPEHATHYSDAHDYWLYHFLIGREKKYNDQLSSQEVGFG